MRRQIVSTMYNKDKKIKLFEKKGLLTYICWASLHWCSLNYKDHEHAYPVEFIKEKNTIILV